MKITLEPPEKRVVLSLRQRGDDVVLVAQNTANGDTQDVLVFMALGTPSPSDPLGQRNEVLKVNALKLRDDIEWISRGVQGYVTIGQMA